MEEQPAESWPRAPYPMGDVPQSPTSAPPGFPVEVPAGTYPEPTQYLPPVYPTPTPTVDTEKPYPGP